MTVFCFLHTAKLNLISTISSVSENIMGLSLILPGGLNGPQFDANSDRAVQVFAINFTFYFLLDRNVHKE